MTQVQPGVWRVATPALDTELTLQLAAMQEAARQGRIGAQMEHARA